MKLFAIGLIAVTMMAQDRVDPHISIKDLSGSEQRPFAPGDGKLSALFFITTDCPISNSYASEIRRICTRNAGHLSCYLVYTDPTQPAATIAKHKSDYRHGDYPAIIDLDHTLVKAVGATTTPEAALVDSHGALVYRGRIDDSYAIWGKRRAVVSDHSLTDAMEAVFAGKPIVQPRTKATGCSITPIEILKSLSATAKPGLQ